MWHDPTTTVSGSEISPTPHRLGFAGNYRVLGSLGDRWVRAMIAQQNPEDYQPNEQFNVMVRRGHTRESTTCRLMVEEKFNGERDAGSIYSGGCQRTPTGERESVYLPRVLAV